MPENHRLHEKPAVVEVVTPWGAHVSCDAAASGRFRALFGEMVPEPQKLTPSGDICTRCGGSNMARAGKCMLCLDCGDQSGGCS